MNNEIIGYERIDKFNPEKLEKLQEHYAAILELLGEDVTREGLEKTPLRVAKSMQFLTQGYTMDPKEILLSAKFKEDYRQMVVVKDIELFSSYDTFHRQGSCRIYTKRLHHRTEQDCPRC